MNDPGNFLPVYLETIPSRVIQEWVILQALLGHLVNNLCLSLSREVSKNGDVINPSNSKYLARI